MSIDHRNDLKKSAPPVWLTSFWGFDPQKWGCVGFATESRRYRFIRETVPGTLIAIYVTKAKGPEKMRGRVVGILEVSHEIGPAEKFTAGDAWASKENDPASRGKWQYGVRITRAWRVIEEDWTPVDELFPTSYAKTNAEIIGSQGVPVEAIEALNLLKLHVFEVPVYGQSNEPDGAIQTISNVLKPSRAILPSKESYWVGETDGPKHLYILRLTGDISAYLGRSKVK